MTERSEQSTGSSSAANPLFCNLSAEELDLRKEQWAGPRDTIYASGALWKYSQLVGATRLGAVTHPGAKGEKHIYMDL